MKYTRRDTWYATLRQVLIGRTTLIMRTVQTLGKPSVRPKVSLKVELTVGKRDFIIATHDQHRVE